MSVQEAINDHQKTSSVEIVSQHAEHSVDIMTRRDDDVFSLKFNVDITSEDFTIVWLDANVHRYTQEYNELYRTSNIIELFENEEDCHQFLDTTSNIRSKKMFVIVSGSLGKTFVPKIHEYKQILFIYIFCQQRKQQSTWARNYKKLGDNRIITQTQNLFDQLTDDIRHTLDAMIPINIFNREKEESIQDLDKDSASAMWFQLVIDVLINMEKTSNAKEEMIHLCDSLYSDNPRVHEQIVDFKQNYCHENAIVWYTKDSFLYRLLNKALRIKNIDVIYPFRFFIADLHRQIHQLHTEFLEFVCTDILTVYRGQQLGVDEIRKLELNIGGLVSINTFLSATLNPKVALTYAGGIKDKSVVFKIQIDIRTNTKVPFGSISHMSEHRFEEEFLFSIGAVFRITAVDQIDNVYYITLKISDDENEEIKHLFSYYYTNYKVNEPTTLITLGMFLHEMGQFDQAAYYYRLMLRNINLSCDYDMQIKLYKQLGYVAKSQGHYQQAIEDYNRALTLILEYNPTNYQDLFEIYNNLGVAYRYVFNFDAALIFMQKTLDLHTNYMELNDSKLSQVFNNLGQVYRSRKEYDNAEFYFKQALHIFNHSTIIPSNHPNRATLLSNLAHLYSEMERYDEAIIKLNEVLLFQLKVLPPNHPHVGRTYNNLACIYLNKKEHYKTALHLLRKTLDIDLKNLSSNHPWTARVYMNIARVYYARNMHLIGWLYAKKAMERQHAFQLNDPDYIKCEEIFEIGQKQIIHIISILTVIFNELEGNTH